MTSERTDVAVLFSAFSLRAGVGTSMINLADGLARKGYSVDVVVTGPRSEPPDWVHERVRMVGLGQRRLRRSLGPMTRYLRTSRPRAVISAGERPNMLAWIAGRLAGAKARLVFTCRGAVSEYFGGWQKVRMQACVRHFYPRADAVVGISEGVSEDIRRLMGRHGVRVRTIYNPVVGASFERLGGGVCDGTGAEPDSPPLVVGAGRLVHDKNFESLLRAFAIARPEREMRLVILGEGPLRSRLESLAQQLGVAEEVEMPGFVVNPFAYFRRAAVFVLSSRLEGFANVVVEAMACGCPVVATDCPHGPREALADGQYGELVAFDDDPAIAAGILDAIDGAQDRRALIGRAMAFRVESQVEAYAELLGIEPGAGR